MTKKSSKEKIMEVATELFGSCGFKGTSVRMISEKAEVNVASINYYFSNKESLFKAVMVNEAISIVNLIGKVLSNSEGLGFADLSGKLFEAFYNNPDPVISCMRLILAFEKRNDKESRIDDSQKEVIRCAHGCLATCLKNDFDKEVSQELEEWASDTMFSHIVHTTLMVNSGFVYEIVPDKNLSLEASLPKIKRLAEAIVKQVGEEMK